MGAFQRLHARCACAGSTGPFVLAGTERKYERSRPFSIDHLDLDVTVDLATKSVTATACLSFSRRSATARELALDALGFSISKVRLDTGKGFRAHEYTYDGEKILLGMAASVKSGKVEIAYRAKP
ncbi:MAG TPA: hypothetical protein VF395_05120, partial [Polyangiaceae bacterium]